MHGRSAIGTVSPRPLVDRNVGAVGVVGFQNLANDQKEIRQMPLPQRLPDQRASISFTELLGFHMRVRDIVGGGGRMRIGG